MAAEAVGADEGSGASEEFAALIPPEANFEVLFSEKAGRFMASVAEMAAGEDFLIESPLVSWPVVAPMLVAADAASQASCLPSWCERCFCALRRTGGEAGAPGPRLAEEEEEAGRAGAGEANAEARRVRRRLADGGPAPSAPEERSLLDALEEAALAQPPGEAEPYCSDCKARAAQQAPFLPPPLLWRWRRWQAARSPESCVGLEAFARCLAQAAATAAALRREAGLEPDAALNVALRPFERLAEPPPGGQVTLHGTSAAEVASELRASEPFRSLLVESLGAEDLADALLSEASIEALAGRLVLNAHSVAVPDVPLAGEPLRAAGVYVLLATMNHDCAPSAEAVFGNGNEVTLRTTRAVSPGDALTLTYVAADAAVTERRARLRHWFFECDCWRCDTESRVQDLLGASSGEDGTAAAAAAASSTASAAA